MSLYRFIASQRELDDLQDLNITTITDSTKASFYTDKKNLATIEFDYNDDNAEKLIAYIKEHLKICPRIELWNTTNNNKDAIIKKCSKNILTKEQIKEVFDSTLDQTKCLVVYNA